MIGTRREVVPAGVFSPTHAPVFTNDSGQYLVLGVDVTAIAAGATLTGRILGKDISGKTSTTLAGVAINAIGTQVLKVGPGIPASANASANDIVPPLMVINCVHGGTPGNITYSVGANLTG